MFLSSKILTQRALFQSCKLCHFKRKLPVSSSITFTRENHSKKKNDQPRNKFSSYALIVASTYLAYEYFKDRGIFPTVSAAVSFLGGARRNNFNFLADVVEAVAPAVVYIEIKDSGRFDFFTGKPTTLSNGSGFIIRENGLILTNAHVVASRPRSIVEVRLHDGRTFKGIVEDVDMQSDLATVRISAKNLPVMKLGKSSDLRPGEFVLAMGSPLALSNTVTSGVVSSTHRGSDELGIRGKDMVYIQTDAAITFGNSGGPLVNLDGEAIGVNSMKVTAGISFAIPIDYVKQFLDNAQGANRIHGFSGGRRKYMGITMLTLTPQIIHELHQRNHHIPFDVKSGVLVWKVIFGSPAHSAGLQPGDIVTHVDGKAVQGANDIYNILGETAAKTLRMTVSRFGQKIEVKVTPEEIS